MPLSFLIIERKIIMSTEENKEINRRVVEEVLNQGNIDLIDEFYDENYIGHMPPDEIKGSEGQKQLFSGFLNGFPDLKITIHDQIAEGDMVASRQTMTGTHKGEFQGIAHTGRGNVRLCLFLAKTSVLIWGQLIQLFPKGTKSYSTNLRL